MDEYAPEKIDETESNQPSSDVVAEVAGASAPLVKSIALFSLVMGPLLAIWDIVGIGNSLHAYMRTIPDALFFHHMSNISIYLDMGLLFVVGGLALALNRRWGRSVTYLAAISCFVAWLAAYALGGVVKRLVDEGEIRIRPRPLLFHFDLPWGLTVFGPLVAIVLIVLLSLPAVGRWARSHAPVPTLPNAKLNATAIASFVCSLIPMGFTQIAGLGLGVGALVQIGKSKGSLRGKALAVAGITISMALLSLIVSLLIAAVSSGP